MHDKLTLKLFFYVFKMTADAVLWQKFFIEDEKKNSFVKLNCTKKILRKKKKPHLISLNFAFFSHKCMRKNSLFFFLFCYFAVLLLKNEKLFFTGFILQLKIFSCIREKKTFSSFFLVTFHIKLCKLVWKLISFTLCVARSRKCSPSKYFFFEMENKVWTSFLK